SVPITSNPAGADLYIDGKYYGKTPQIVNLEPSKTYTATAVREGFGTGGVKMEAQYSARGNRGGSDNLRCVLDSMTIILPVFGWFIPPYSIHCSDFKEKNYVINIQNTMYSPANNNSS